MRLHFTTSWIFQGWIVFFIALCIQEVFAKPSGCGQNQYKKDNVCCSKCEPGKYLYAECEGNKDTVCVPCGTNEYQPDWNLETKCIQQKYCDTGKGFSPTRPSNATAPVPCQCKQGYQCSVINCEFCVKIPPCRPGHGFVMKDSGEGSCEACKYGFFSDSDSIDPCKKWTDCKANGKTEKRPGTATADVTCGPPHTGPQPWLVVEMVLSIIVVVSLIILFLFCYKNRLTLLTVNLRSCVQSLKRTRIQQETSTPPFSSSNGQQTCTLYEITCHLIRQDDDPAKSFSMCPSSRLTSPKEESDKPDQERDGDQADGSSSTPSEMSEGGPSSPLSGSSCSCVLSMKEPVEVGENEDCSQVVAPGVDGSCSCGGVDPEAGEGGSEGQTLLQEAFLCDNCCPENVGVCGERSQLQESHDLYLCDHATKEQTVPGERGCRGDGALVQGLYRQNEPCCCSIDSTTMAMMSSVSANNQGLTLIDSNDMKLSESDPEYQGQCTEAALTSGQVTGNNNTTFISNGQVMNFSGDVIVVYVSQTSLGGGSADTEEPFSCPVQEQSNEESFQSAPKPSISTTPPQRSLPVQEASDEWPLKN
ncbi:tumor necrosis factor receptor superfamily member 11A [Chanos chanos]|uniref:Tumor necrosis factor receptor superfamily member 11A n=1 Tax=Chanos chanos TaxID=29144 RepID=A0A6J2UWE4_CHACN|nr:tumor necrosis factor receptor superfamily member 11A [Chanos chanos]